MRRVSGVCREHQIHIINKQTFTFSTTTTIDATCFTCLQQPLPRFVQLPPTTGGPPDDDNDVAEPRHQLISARHCDGVG